MKEGLHIESNKGQLTNTETRDYRIRKLENVRTSSLVSALLAPKMALPVLWAGFNAPILPRYLPSRKPQRQTRIHRTKARKRGQINNTGVS